MQIVKDELIAFKVGVKFEAPSLHDGEFICLIFLLVEYLTIL